MEASLERARPGLARGSPPPLSLQPPPRVPNLGGEEKEKPEADPVLPPPPQFRGGNGGETVGKPLFWSLCILAIILE